MIDRYAPPEIADALHRRGPLPTWLEVEILATEAWAKLGVVPRRRRGRRSGSAPTSTSTAIREREQVTDHETAAFVDVVQERIGGPAAKWVHYGLTSYDVVDTALPWPWCAPAT